MKLLIDQSKVSKLLAECANSSMPVDVRRFCIRPAEGKGLGIGPAQAPRPVGGHGGLGGIGRPPVPQAMGGGGQSRSDDETNVSDIPIEIEGVIYIYNPPTLKDLETVAIVEEPTGPTPPDDLPAPPDDTPAPAPGTPPVPAPGIPPATPTTPPVVTPPVPTGVEP
jgi:hypothetical protein